VGTRYRYTARFAGRPFQLVREVTAYEPNRRQAVKTISGPLRWGGTRTFEAIPGGTRITFSGGGQAGGFFGLAEPLLLRAAQRSLRNDLATLKRLLEGRSQA
jgi:Polyketide cyclase / dehydrase and lipid transport